MHPLRKPMEPIFRLDTENESAVPRSRAPGRDGSTERHPPCAYPPRCRWPEREAGNALIKKGHPNVEGKSTSLRGYSAPFICTCQFGVNVPTWLVQSGIRLARLTVSRRGLAWLECCLGQSTSAGLHVLALLHGDGVVVREGASLVLQMPFKTPKSAWTSWKRQPCSSGIRSVTRSTKLRLQMQLRRQSKRSGTNVKRRRACPSVSAVPTWLIPITTSP